VSALSAEIARRHNEAHSQLVDSFGDLVAQIWLAQGSPNLDTVTIGFLMDIAEGMGATIAGVSEQQTVASLVSLGVDDAKSGVPDLSEFSAKFEKSIESSRLRFLRELKQGATFEEARETSSQYLAERARGEAGTAMVAGARAAGEANGLKFWRKVPNGSACDWCRTVSGQRYTAAEKVPRHGSCRCSIAPDDPDERKRSEILPERDDDGEIVEESNVIASPVYEGVEVSRAESADVLFGAGSAQHEQALSEEADRTR